MLALPAHAVAGPESLSLDISFPVHGQVYGIPQHASPLALPTTTGEGAFYEDPYRLWNSDVFEYAADSTMSLYGSIPLLHAHGKQGTVGVFNALGSETFVDVHHPASDATNTYWISESGVLDVFLLPGPTPEAVFQQYAGLTGTPPLPAIWQLGYHQCRWNYVSSDDVRTVQRRFDEEDMPVDVFWLDIDYSPDHKYFIWKDKEFPDPVEMTNDVAANKRKVLSIPSPVTHRLTLRVQMVVIIDPHLKRADDFAPYKEAADRGVLVKNKDGNDYEGWCWPGSSSWVDFFHPDSWAFRTTPEKTFTWTKSTNDVHIWNDMNEVRCQGRKRRLILTCASPPSLTVRRSACRVTTFITAAGSTAMCTTSTACSS
jgi:alpha 1,3-glucosidase